MPGELLSNQAASESQSQAGTSTEASDSLQTYRRLPTRDRNWRSDAGFQLLSEPEKHDQLVAEAIRDTISLSETLRRAVSNSERRDRLRHLLLEIEFELQAEE
jgi:hypothetical protein